MPRLLLSAAHQLAYFYCYSYACLCHCSTWLLLHTLRWSPCCTPRMEWAFRTAARLIGGIPRTGHVSTYMLDVFHWLPFQQKIISCRPITTLVWRCLFGLAPTYLQDLCCPTLGTRGRSSLHSIERGVLFVPFPYFHKADPCILGCWLFCVEWTPLVLQLRLSGFMLTHSALA